MTSELIKRDIEDFQRAVKKLSAGIGKASSLWKDAKFSELSSSVGEIAYMSKDIIVTGEQCCHSIEKLNKIAAEEY